MERQKKIFITKSEKIQELKTNAIEQKLFELNSDAEEWGAKLETR